MKRTIVALLLLSMVVVSFFSACGKGGNELVGHWVAASDHIQFPDEIILKKDGSGILIRLVSYADDISLTWYADGNILTIVTEEYGESTYSYKISGDKMWLDNGFSTYLLFRN